MKILISHSSANTNIGNAFVNLLTGIGVRHDEIVFTSNEAYGIPTGEKIFDWLRKQISNRPYVVYLLSNEYYKSVACLNEMGAAWIIENEHVILFTPGFDIDCPEFQSGALDPREMGFFINNESRLLQFIESLRTGFSITSNVVVINQRVKEFLSIMHEITANKKQAQKENYPIPIEKKTAIIPTEYLPVEKAIVEVPIKHNHFSGNVLFMKLQTEILEKKLKDSEIILFQYIIDTGKSKLGIGWQESEEASNIREWEDIKGIAPVLSSNYSSVIKRLIIRRYLEDSAFTASGNAKEVKLNAELVECIFDLPKEVINVIDEILNNNPKQEIPNW